MDPLNVLSIFEIRSFSRSWDNRGYPKNLCRHWKRPCPLFSKLFNGLLFRWTLVIVLAKSEVRSFTSTWDNRGYPKKMGSPWIRPRSLFSTIFNGTPYYLRNGKSYAFQIWPVHSEGPSEQNPIKSFGEKGAWAYLGTAQIFGVPLLSQEREKLRISNLASTFRGSIRTKAH